MVKPQRFLMDDGPTPVSHYCHAVRVGDHIWLSGMTGRSAAGEIPDDVVDQFDVAMANMDHALRAAGGAPENIVKVTIYLTDIVDRPKINPQRINYFGEHLPASTLVEVSGLVDPRLKVEIEAVAVLA